MFMETHRFEYSIRSMANVLECLVQDLSISKREKRIRKI
ncbi:hypothetical protein LEP1GSC074_1938 [Leptospira noguchii str. Hook]|nr:hypothetical protein LEP1GSC074_1938 [Leptospira noguchii str. Hook]